MTTPDLDACKAYLTDAGVTFDPDAAPDPVAAAFAAETASQANRCQIPDDGLSPPTLVYPDDLVEALYARTARRLVLRGLPLGISPSVADGAVAVPRVGGLDAEVGRLEAPYRRVVFG